MVAATPDNLERAKAVEITRRRVCGSENGGNVTGRAERRAHPARYASFMVSEGMGSAKGGKRRQARVVISKWESIFPAARRVVF